VEETSQLTYDSGNVEKLTEDTALWRPCTGIASNISNTADKHGCKFSGNLIFREIFRKFPEILAKA